MANNYTQWSESIALSDFDDTREAEKLWIRKALMSYDEWSGEVEEGGDRSVDAFEQHLSEVGVVDLVRCNNLDCWPDFGWEIESDRLWVYSEESGSIDNLSIFIMSFLKKFMPTASFSLQWASTCGKMRIGEFNGGAMVVTSNAVLIKGTWTVVDEMLKELGFGKDDE